MDITGRTRAFEGGFALPVAVFALVIGGVLATAGFFMARQEMRVGLASENATLAVYLAENGAADLVEDWDTTVFGRLEAWTDTTVTLDYPGLGSVDAKVTRLTERLYFAEMHGVVSRGGSQFTGAQRRIGMMLRMNTVELDPPAALTTRGGVAIQGAAEVRGEDIDPPTWDGYCSGNREDRPGIVTSDTSRVSRGGALTGNPPMVEDTTIADASFTRFGDLQWNDLIATADITLGGGSINGTGPDSTAAGECNSGRDYPTNWGNPLDPGAACGDWFPLVYISADASIQSNGVGQGVLLVDGDLELRGGFVFHGVIITQGRFETRGSGHRILGAVMAGNASLATQSLSGTSAVQNSTCAVTRALLLNSALTRVAPLNERSYVDVSSIQND